MDVDCTSARELLSAQLDDEVTTVERAVADHHLHGCAACTTWTSDVALITRSLRVRPAEAVPDLASGVLARAHPAAVGRRQWVRVTLAVVAAAELVLALPGLFGGAGAGAVHAARHLGSFGVAIAIGLLYVAWRPGRAFGMLTIIVALACTMVVSAVVDIANGRASTVAEARHVLELSGLVLVWVLAGRPLPRLPAPSRLPSWSRRTRPIAHR